MSGIQRLTEAEQCDLADRIHEGVVQFRTMTDADIERITSASSPGPRPDDYLLSDLDDDGRLVSRMGIPLVAPLVKPAVKGFPNRIVDEDAADPTAELQRHLTDALAVMLRHPQLTVDAGTLKLLARRPKLVRDEKGRWRRVQ